MNFRPIDLHSVIVVIITIYTGVYSASLSRCWPYSQQDHRTVRVALYRRVNFVKPVPNLNAGFIMLIIATNRLHIEMSFYNVAGYLLLLISSICITYAIFLTPQILTFWTVKTDAIRKVADKCWDFNNMPMNIYNKLMRRIGVFIIPVFFITNLPAMFLGGRLNSLYITWAIVAPILFLTFVRIFWCFAIQNYSSASS